MSLSFLGKSHIYMHLIETNINRRTKEKETLAPIGSVSSPIDCLKKIELDQRHFLPIFTECIVKLHKNHDEKDGQEDINIHQRFA